MGENEAVDLQKRDWQFVLDAVYRINAIFDVDSFQNEVLSCLRNLIPNKQGTFFIIEMRQGIACSARPAVVGEPVHHLEEFMSGIYDDDPYFNGLYLKTVSHAFRDTDMIPEHIRKSSRIYRDIYEPEDSIYILRLLFACHGESIGEASLFKSSAQGDFSVRDVHIANLLAPHIALKLSDLLKREKEDSEKRDDCNLLCEYNLTQREEQIIQLIVEGQQELAIANSLCISLSTVKKHVYNAYRKLDVGNRAQLLKLVGIR